MAKPETLETVLDDVRREDWERFAVPPVARLWAYDSARVVPAFEMLAAVADEPSATTAYHLLMNTLGHNHSGTPYPAIVPGMRYLVRLVPLLTGWQRAAALDASADAFGFTLGDTALPLADGTVVDLTAAHRDVATLAPMLTALALNEGTQEPGAACDLLELLADEPT